MHLTMNAPVWYIFDRLSGILGGDGWHRSNLIDQFIKHFEEWWLMGMPFENTGDWAATVIASGGVDVTNYYVSIGIAGGLISLIFFLAVLKSCFGYVGTPCRQSGIKMCKAKLWRRYCGVPEVQCAPTPLISLLCFTGINPM